MSEAIQMLKMREEGATLQQIADAFGVTRQRVHQRLKKAGMQTKTTYFSQDITFCSNRECGIKTCHRNACHIDWTCKPYHSFSNFDGTQYCPKRKDGADNDD